MVWVKTVSTKRLRRERLRRLRKGTLGSPLGSHYTLIQEVSGFHTCLAGKNRLLVRSHGAVICRASSTAVHARALRFNFAVFLSEIRYDVRDKVAHFS